MEKIVNFNSYDGTYLTGIFTCPDKAINHAVLMMHGLPSDKDEWGFYSDMSEFFLLHDIATFRFDFRYNGESKKGNLADITISEMILDIESAYWQLSNLVGKNVNISAVGTSCGGGVTVRWRNIFERHLKNVFLMAPVLDYEFEVTGKVRNISTHKLSSLPEEVSNILLKNGVLNDEIGYGLQMINEAHLFDIIDEFKKNNVPIIIFQGDLDTVVPIYITQEKISLFPMIRLVIIPNSDHGFATLGDNDLSDPITKKNHFTVFNEMLSILL